MKKQLEQDLERAIKGIAYCELALNSELQNWERKEYQAVLKMNTEEAESLKERIEFLNN